MTTLTYYHSPDCGACHELEPVIRKAAREKGMRFKKVNVDECHTETCDNIGLFPTIHIDGRELSTREMEKLIDAKD